jgi:hypothetical protein
VNETVPPGAPAPGATAATIVVKVTGWPTVDEPTGIALRLVVVDAWPTAYGIASSLPRELASPPYVASTKNGPPTGSLLTVQIALYGPGPLRPTVPHPAIAFPAAEKATVPPPSPPVTFAVKVTGWPNALGLVGDADIAVEVVAMVMSCEIAGDVLGDSSSRRR